MECSRKRGKGPETWQAENYWQPPKGLAEYPGKSYLISFSFSSPFASIAKGNIAVGSIGERESERGHRVKVGIELIGRVYREGEGEDEGESNIDSEADSEGEDDGQGGM